MSCGKMQPHCTSATAKVYRNYLFLAASRLSEAVIHNFATFSDAQPEREVKLQSQDEAASCGTILDRLKFHRRMLVTR